MSVPEPKLTAPGWTDENRTRLQALIRAGSGQHWPVVLDFDNTLVCGDIGEATLAMLTRDRVLDATALPAEICPTFCAGDGRTVALRSSIDLTEYYEALLDPTCHGSQDPTPLASGYVWAVEVMQGLPVLEIVRATQRVYDLSQPLELRRLEVTPGRTAYPVPFFYPEMVELVGELLRHEYDVWIISASNVWSVRWMILRALNPMVQAAGVERGIAADHVVGVSALLEDGQGRLYKDAVLVRDNAAYSSLDEAVLRNLRLSRFLQFPVPTYSGKVGAIWDLIGCRPYLGAGDSPGDHAMLGFCENRLWLARVEKPGYQEATRQLIARLGESSWIRQPIRSKQAPGFVARRLS